MEKLRLNDASFQYEPENSPALGLGFRAGFLGLLHREIVQERLERDYGLSLITTAPSVGYRVTDRPGGRSRSTTLGDAGSDRDRGDREPVIEAVILTPDRYLGACSSCSRSAAASEEDGVYRAGRVLLTYSLR